MEMRLVPPTKLGATITGPAPSIDDLVIPSGNGIAAVCAPESHDVDLIQLLSADILREGMMEMNEPHRQPGAPDPPLRPQAR